MEVAAGGEVPRYRRGPLPHLTPAERITVIVRVQRTPRYGPATLPEQQQQQHRSHPLAAAHIKASQTHLLQAKAFTAFTVRRMVSVCGYSSAGGRMHSIDESTAYLSRVLNG